MRKSDIVIGGYYTARVSGVIVPVRIESEHPSGGWWATNVKTGRRIRIKTAGRLRFRAAQRLINEALA